MAPELSPATWAGPFPAILADGRRLEHGAEAMVTEQDLASGHWAPKPATARSKQPPAAPAPEPPPAPEAEVKA